MRQSIRRLRFSLKSESDIDPNGRIEAAKQPEAHSGPSGLGRNNERLNSSSSGSSIGEEIPIINKKHYREEKIEIGKL